jgi:hypothetical protein
MLDKNGKITDVAIGVGGFLGMGERDVAVKFDQLKWSNEPVKSTDSKKEFRQMELPWQLHIACLATIVGMLGNPPSTRGVAPCRESKKTSAAKRRAKTRKKRR